MQFTLFLSTLLVAAAGVSAAPAEVQFTKRAESVPVDIYNGGICTGTIASTTYLPTDGLCFPLYAILSGNTNSVKIPAGALPAGCTVTLYSDRTCSSVNYIPLSSSNQCVAFGEVGKYVFSAKTSGTC